jgi:hypothetical protein
METSEIFTASPPAADVLEEPPFSHVDHESGENPFRRSPDIQGVRRHGLDLPVDGVPVRVGSLPHCRHGHPFPLHGNMRTADKKSVDGKQGQRFPEQEEEPLLRSISFSLRGTRLLPADASPVGDERKERLDAGREQGGVIPSADLDSQVRRVGEKAVGAAHVPSASRVAKMRGSPAARIFRWHDPMS